MKRLVLTFALGCAGCPVASNAPPTVAELLDSGLFATSDCKPIQRLDAGALGTAQMVYTPVLAAENAWQRDATLVSAAGLVGDDGRDADGGEWEFSLQGPGGQFGQAVVSAQGLVLSGSCATLPTGSGALAPDIQGWSIDSDLAVATMLDAGCALVAPINLQLRAQGTSLPNAPSWSATPADGGACVVNASSGSYGTPAPDGGPDAG